MSCFGQTSYHSNCSTFKKKKVAKYDNEKEMVKKRVEGWLRIGQDDWQARAQEYTLRPRGGLIGAELDSLLLLFNKYWEESAKKRKASL